MRLYLTFHLGCSRQGLKVDTADSRGPHGHGHYDCIPGCNPHSTDDSRRGPLCGGLVRMAVCIADTNSLRS